MFEATIESLKTVMTQCYALSKTQHDACNYMTANMLNDMGDRVNDAISVLMENREKGDGCACQSGEANKSEA